MNLKTCSARDGVAVVPQRPPLGPLIYGLRSSSWTDCTLGTCSKIPYSRSRLRIPARASSSSADSEPKRCFTSSTIACQRRCQRLGSIHVLLRQAPREAERQVVEAARHPAAGQRRDLAPLDACRTALEEHHRRDHRQVQLQLQVHTTVPALLEAAMEAELLLGHRRRDDHPGDLGRDHEQSFTTAIDLRYDVESARWQAIQIPSHPKNQPSPRSWGRPSGDARHGD